MKNKPCYSKCWRCLGAKVVLVCATKKQKVEKKCGECNGIGILRNL